VNEFKYDISKDKCLVQTCVDNYETQTTTNECIPKINQSSSTTFQATTLIQVHTNESIRCIPRQRDLSTPIAKSTYFDVDMDLDFKDKSLALVLVLVFSCRFKQSIKIQRLCKISI
jgi:hypothetical protein